MLFPRIRQTSVQFAYRYTIPGGALYLRIKRSVCHFLLSAQDVEGRRRDERLETKKRRNTATTRRRRRRRTPVCVAVRHASCLSFFLPQQVCYISRRHPTARNDSSVKTSTSSPLPPPCPGSSYISSSPRRTSTAPPARRTCTRGCTARRRGAGSRRARCPGEKTER